MSRKGSKEMFAAVLNQLSETKEVAMTEVRSSSPHLLKVAAGVRQIQERSEAAERLLRTGEQIVELDPDIILPSRIQDRYDEAYEAEAVAEMVASMRLRGQILPGLVRPIKDEQGADALEIVFGRRRQAAARLLGFKFRAIIRELTDEEAVILQGEENTQREDLSFIEKCVFALAQEEARFKRETICASLSTGKSHISEMISIATEIPNELLRSIGKAPGIGRPRWAALAKKLSSQGEGAWRPVISFSDFKSQTSEERFEAVFKALSTNVPERGDTKARSWVSADKGVSVLVKSTSKRAVVTYEAKNGPGFARYISGRLEALYEDFLKANKALTGD